MTCEREPELLSALQRGYVHDELLAHVRACEPCGELHLVAGALLHDHGDAVAHAAVPSAGTMWWRIQLRRQQEVEAAARRSLLVGQAATLVIALSLVAAYFGIDALRHVVASIRFTLPVLIGLAVWAIAAPLAGWAAIRGR